MCEYIYIYSIHLNGLDYIHHPVSNVARWLHAGTLLWPSNKFIKELVRLRPYTVAIDSYKSTGTIIFTPALFND